jgi:hypothetical protein
MIVSVDQSKGQRYKPGMLPYVFPDKGELLPACTSCSAVQGRIGLCWHSVGCRTDDPVLNHESEGVRAEAREFHSTREEVAFVKVHVLINRH